VNVEIFAAAAALLSLERIAYVWIWRAPDAFRAACEDFAQAGIGEPVDALRFLFYAFKALQGAVFLAWCYAHARGTLWPPDGEPWSIALGTALVLVGQLLNLSVFHRLGNVGVFYGNRFGHDVAWCRSFPFSIVDHPQYVGALLSIWGFFLVMRFPHPDWYALPALETVYYGFGARFER
jgi:methylene-fatty-acyl-phospholipid synthase